MKAFYTICCFALPLLLSAQTGSDGGPNGESITRPESRVLLHLLSLETEELTELRQTIERIEAMPEDEKSRLRKRLQEMHRMDPRRLRDMRERFQNIPEAQRRAMRRRWLEMAPGERMEFRRQLRDMSPEERRAALEERGFPPLPRPPRGREGDRPSAGPPVGGFPPEGPPPFMRNRKGPFAPPPPQAPEASDEPEALDPPEEPGG